jgi:hypothetical protein
VNKSNLKPKAKKAPKAHAHFADCSFRLRSRLFFLKAELQNQELCRRAGERHIRSLRAERKGYQCDHWATPVSLCSEIADSDGCRRAIPSLNSWDSIPFILSAKISLS